MNEADMPGTSRFLTLADTAELLNVSASQVYALVRSRELPAIKVGGHGHWRIERSVLETYVADRYEETRRIGLWNQSEYASIQEIATETLPAETLPAEAIATEPSTTRPLAEEAFVTPFLAAPALIRDSAERFGNRHISAHETSDA